MDAVSQIKRSLELPLDDVDDLSIPEIQRRREAYRQHGPQYLQAQEASIGPEGMIGEATATTRQVMEDVAPYASPGTQKRTAEYMAARTAQGAEGLSDTFNKAVDYKIDEWRDPYDPTMRYSPLTEQKAVYGGKFWEEARKLKVNTYEAIRSLESEIPLDYSDPIAVGFLNAIQRGEGGKLTIQNILSRIEDDPFSVTSRDITAMRGYIQRIRNIPKQLGMDKYEGTPVAETRP